MSGGDRSKFLIVYYSKCSQATFSDVLVRALAKKYLQDFRFDYGFVVPDNGWDPMRSWGHNASLFTDAIFLVMRSSRGQEQH